MFNYSYMYKDCRDKSFSLRDRISVEECPKIYLCDFKTQKTRAGLVCNMSILPLLLLQSHSLQSFDPMFC